MKPDLCMRFCITSNRKKQREIAEKYDVLFNGRQIPDPWLIKLFEKEILSTIKVEFIP